MFFKFYLFLPIFKLTLKNFATPLPHCAQTALESKWSRSANSQSTVFAAKA